MIIYFVSIKSLVVLLGGGIGLPVLGHERLELCLPHLFCEGGYFAHAVLVGTELYCCCGVR